MAPVKIAIIVLLMIVLFGCNDSLNKNDSGSKLEDAPSAWETRYESDLWNGQNVYRMKYNSSGMTYEVIYMTAISQMQVINLTKDSLETIMLQPAK